MKLVSTTLAGPGTEAIVGDALRSVAPLVSRVEILWTGQSDGNELRRAVGPWAYAVTDWPWRDDFAAARNAALDVATEAGADWSIAVDTDERLRCSDPAAFRAWLAALPAAVQVVLVRHVDGSHARERIFRHQTKARFVGRTHECITVGPGEQAVAPPELVALDELSKSAGQMRAKRERDERLLRAQIEEAPHDARWRYYLGDTIAALARPCEAVAAFRSCAELRGWDEESAWACYRAAAILTDTMGWHDEAIDAAVSGLARHAGIAELCWIAGLASYRAGKMEQAVRWSQLALQHADGSLAERARVGFRERKGLRDGPWEVLHFALAALGDHVGAAHALRRREQARG